MYSDPAIIVHLKLLFNMMYLHGFVPDEFGKGVTNPIPKDRLGDMGHSTVRGKKLVPRTLVTKCHGQFVTICFF